MTWFGIRIERVPITRNHLIEKDSLKIKELEHVRMRHRIYPMSKYRKSRATFSGHALAFETNRDGVGERPRWRRPPFAGAGRAIAPRGELMGVSKRLLVPSVIDAVVKKVNQKRITNSKDLRKLRAILPDPVARAHFLSEEGDLDSAQLRLRVIEKNANDGLLTNPESAVEAMKTVPWTTLQEMKGDTSVLKKIEDAEELLKSLRKVLSST
jgi:hypothetical protein